MKNGKHPLCWATTGIEGLDKVINNLRLGDNVVWQVQELGEYKYFVKPFVAAAKRDGKRVVYMRFAEHEALFDENDDVVIYNLDAQSGFEMFTMQIHNIIKDEGVGVYYVFDSLSDLLSAWATDLMIGNFFMVTCPYLFELDTVTYFALIRNSHSYKTIARIRETTQLLIDIYRVEEKYYMHPLKVWNRYSPTMFLPHVQEKDKFMPITSSMDTSKLFAHLAESGVEIMERRLDYWDKLFIKAEEVQATGTLEKKWEMIEQLSKVMLGREKRMLDLVRTNFSLEDIIAVKTRMTGTGYVGGKSAGMLLSRKILENDKEGRWAEVLEPHDSFYVGSDFFYTYIVQNGLWRLRMQQRTREGYFTVAKELKERILKGRFPDEIKEQLWQIIEYFGQSPIIIRSSSLLEDSFGNAFAGKYESIFSVNQGSPEHRYRMLEEYIKEIFASTMSDDALTYRLQRGLDQQDEQMALLIQRVSGSQRKHYFFPDAAGVGISYNTFVWKENMDPQSGMLRLVFGLGTRAVNRVDDDYPKIIALDDPLTSPTSGKEDDARFSQHKVDLLNVSQNSFETTNIGKLMKEKTGTCMEYFGRMDREATQKLKDLGLTEEESWIIDFKKLIKETKFIEKMQKMLKTLEKAYSYPVDIEFTLNFTDENNFKINLLQCRPLQTMGEGKRMPYPEKPDSKKVLFESAGNFMGGNISEAIDKIIYVDPKTYVGLTMNEKYAVARAVGRLNRNIEDRRKTSALIIGPGRWGTSTPSLGVPVSFSEINNVSMMVELDFKNTDMSPDLSFGTHFFQDLVETNIFYAAIFSQKKGSFFNEKLLGKLKSGKDAADIEALSEAKDWIKVFNLGKNKMYVISDLVKQRIICYLREK
ncbi:MAG: PEP/pyruvate-binding domain-containing protein [Endomicrobiales bacterium]|nr:PEP/pyruvate-binding domain-containing protein [Endomicrobiales bacterium]